MSKKNSKLKPVIAMTLNLQLFISSSAFAAQDKDERKWTKAAEVTNAVTGMADKAMHGMKQMQMQQMAAQQQAQLQQQFSIKPITSPTQVPPILLQNGCLVLEARTDRPADSCDPKQFDPQKAASGYYTALFQVAENNENNITNFLTHGHERATTQGIGCYEKSLKQFTGMLEARVEALNQLEASIEKEVQAFQKLAEKDIEDLKRGNALLEGTPEEFLKDVRFEDKFNDTQCASFIGSNEIKSTGRKGFRAIASLLDGKVSQPKKGLNPQELKAKTAQIRNDIRKIAKNVAKFSKDKKSLQVDPSKLGMRTNTLSTKSPAVSAIVAEVSTAAVLEQQDLLQEVTKATGGAQKEIIEGIQTDSIDLDNALFNYERSQKNNCLNAYLKSNFGSESGIISRLMDPNVSAKANRESDSAFKNAIVAILNDNDYTLEQKMRRIKEEESKNGNSRYTMTTGKSMSVKGKSIGASTRLRASDMLSVFADNCSQRFESVATDSGKSQREIINSIKSFKQKNDQLQKKFAAKLEQDLINEIENCPTNQATGKAELSCNGALDTGSENFCLRTANICASNMLACQDKAQKMVETTRKEQQAIAKRYKQNMDQFKAKLVTQFNSANLIMEQTARQLDGMYAMGSIYNTPVGLDMNLLTNKLMKDSGIDKSLQIEDPKQYLALMKENISKLKKEVIASNNEILNGGKKVGSAGNAAKYAGFAGELKKYEDNYKKQQDDWHKIKNNCMKLITQYNQMEQDRYQQESEANNEYNQKIGTLCRKLEAFEENPAGFCDEASELGDEIFEIAAVSGDSKAAADIKAFGKACDSFGSEDGSNRYDSTGSRGASRGIASTKSMTPSEYCAENSDLKECYEYQTALGPYENGQCPVGTEVSITKSDAEQYGKYKNDSGNYVIDKKTSLTGLDIKFVELDINDSEDIKLLEPKLASSKLADKKCYISSYLSEKELNKIESKEKDIQKYIAQQERAEYYSSMGDISVSACNSTYDGGQGKDFLNGLGEQMGRSLGSIGAQAY